MTQRATADRSERKALTSKRLYGRGRGRGLTRGAGGILGHLRSFALVLGMYATPRTIFVKVEDSAV